MADNLTPSCADCLENWEPQSLRIIRDRPGLDWNCLTFTLLILSAPFSNNSSSSCNSEGGGVSCAVVVCECETWSVTPRQRFRKFAMW
jgi:hypothetical protein